MACTTPRPTHNATRIGIKDRATNAFLTTTTTTPERASELEMAVRRTYGQLWARTPQQSEDEEHPPVSDECSSDLSELDSATPSEDDDTPDTEMYDSDETKCDEEEEHDFQRRDSVWVKPKRTSTWYHGVITKIKQPTESSPKGELLYLVVFRRYHTNLRAWFSPLEGNMRPDTPQVRALILGSS